MIKEKEQVLRKLLMVVDIFMVLFAFFTSFIVRQHLHILYRIDLFPERQVMAGLSNLAKYLNILPFILFIWWASLTSSGLYESFRKKGLFEIMWGIIKAGFFTMVVMAVIIFIFKLSFISRTFMLLFFFTSCVFLAGERLSIAIFLRFSRRKGYNYRNILIVGTGQRAQNFIKLVHSHTEWGLRIAGLIDAESAMIGREVAGEKVIGLLKDIPGILREKVIDEVMYIIPRAWLSQIEESLLACEIQGVKTNIAADFFNLKIARSVSTDIEGMPLLKFETTAGKEWQLLLKRLFDIILSLIAVIISFPLFLLLLCCIKVLTPGPAIFKQVRSGLNNRKFVMYKFRTMKDGAEGQRHELSAYNDMKGPAFKMANDPRVTSFGKFLRRSSMDELPQVFNVLKGDMSLVGPRPAIPSEIEKYEVWQRRRLSMKPGLTCLWQVNGRNNVDFDRWMKLDLEYIDTWSLGLDFKILLRTIPSVLFSIGAR